MENTDLQSTKSDLTKADNSQNQATTKRTLSVTENEVNNANPTLRKSRRLFDLPQISYYESDEDDINIYLLYSDSTTFEIPKSYQEAKQSDNHLQWEEAIKSELESLKTNKTWIIVPRPKNKNIIQYKWVFTLKTDEIGNPFRYKARVVAEGFSQKYMSDYSETFATVARISTFRLLMALANQSGLEAHHMDVKTAFLNGSES